MRVSSFASVVAKLTQCSDARGMSKDVTAALTAIIQTSKQCSPEEAGQVIAQLIQSGRLLYDVWA